MLEPKKQQEDIMNKLTSLVKFLGVEKAEITQGYNQNIFETLEGEYLVLTDKEADKYTKEYILDTAWAFQNWFIKDNLNSKFRKVDSYLIDEVISLAKEKCEDGNELILSMITKRSFVNDAMRYDGRGHFLASYDGIENQQDCYYIYRIN